MKIAHLANFYSPKSGGLRTTMESLSKEYVASGHQVLLITPGVRTELLESGGITRLTVAAPVVPWSGGYRVIFRLSVIRAALENFTPDIIELSDRTSLLPVASWAKKREIPVYFFAHEKVHGVISAFAPWLPFKKFFATFWNKVTGRCVDHIIATTEIAASEFDQIPDFLLKKNVEISIVPLGVDLATFTPSYELEHSASYMVACTRLSKEKDPKFLLEIMAEVSKRKLPITLEIIGTGPLELELKSIAQQGFLSINFHGHLRDKEKIQKLMAEAEVFLAVGPIETFGLAALESLACGTPVICRETSAIREIIDSKSGAVLQRDVNAWADQIEKMLQKERITRRNHARKRAEIFSWQSTAIQLLEIYGHKLVSA